MARKLDVEYVNFYTVGSAALQYDPMPAPKKKASLPKPRRRKKIRIYVDPVTLLGGIVAVILLVMVICGCGELNAVRQEQAQMQAYVQRLEVEKVSLQQQFEAGYDPDEIYQIATAMGMIPADQAQKLQVQVTVPEAEKEPTGWENFCMFLSGLFA